MTSDFGHDKTESAPAHLLAQAGEPPVDDTRVGADEADFLPPARLTAASLARQRRRVMARMWAAAEAQIQEIESRLALLQDGVTDVEREARTLALLARVVRELSREADAKVAPAGAGRPARAASRRFPAIHRNDPAGGEDEPTARNLEQLRDDLARHLERLRDAAGVAGAAGDSERA